MISAKKAKKLTKKNPRILQRIDDTVYLIAIKYYVNKAIKEKARNGDKSMAWTTHKDYFEKIKKKLLHQGYKVITKKEEDYLVDYLIQW